MNKLKTKSSPLTLITGQSYNQMEDVELLELCKKKDQTAFETLMKRHQRSVYAILYKMAPDWPDTADLAQEAFIRIWRGIDKLQNPRAFKSWLTQIVTNIFYDELRKRPRHVTMVSLDQPVNEDEDGPSRAVADPSDGPDELFARKDVRQAVDKAIATLPRQFRTAIVLRELEDLPYEEIARITATDIGTVKSRISRARTKVQEILRPQFRPDNAA